MVHPDHFGHGIGSRLCDHSLETARQAGFLAMQFNAVVSTNHRALGFVDLYIMHRFL